MASKSDPPSFKLEVPFAQEIAALGFEAFDDPDEITKTTAGAIKTIIEDQKANRGDNDSKTSLALLAVMTKMRREQRRSNRVFKLIAFTIAVAALTIFLLDKAGYIKFVH